MNEKTGRREKKKQQSRQAILNAAVSEFAKRGFKETSVAEIMEAAKLGLGTFYNYFDSKEDILVELLGTLVFAVESEVESLKNAGGSSLDLLLTSSRITAKFLDENRFVLPLFISASDHSARPEGSRIKTPAPGFKRLFEKIIGDGQAAGEIRSDVPAELITEMFHSVYQAAAFSHLPIPFTENIAMKTRLLIDGIKITKT